MNIHGRCSDRLDTKQEIEVSTITAVLPHKHLLDFSALKFVRNTTRRKISFVQSYVLP